MMGHQLLAAVRAIFASARAADPGGAIMRVIFAA